MAIKSAKTCGSKKKSTSAKVVEKIGVKPVNAKSKSKSSRDKSKQSGRKVKQSSRDKKSIKLVDLTETKEYEGPLAAAVKNEAVECREDCKFVIDKQSGGAVDVPIYKSSPRDKPRSVAALLDGLKCHGSLLSSSATKVSALPRKAIEMVDKRSRQKAKKARKSLKSKPKASPTTTGNDKVKDPWSDASSSKKKSSALNLALPPADPVLSLPLSYNPDPNSIGLREVVKVAAKVLTAHDRKLEKISRVASAIRGAKPLSMREQLAEWSAGLFDSEEVKEENKDGEDADAGESSVTAEKKPQRKLTKNERKHKKGQEKIRLSAEYRRKQKRLMHDFYRLRAIKSEVSAAAARRNALQSEEAQKLAKQRRLTSIWHRRVLRQATICANRQREAADIVVRAPAELIGDTSNKVGDNSTCLRLITPRTKSLLFEHFTKAQRKGMLLDYRSMESSRRAATQRKRHGYKRFQIDR